MFSISALELFYKDFNTQNWDCFCSPILYVGKHNNDPYKTQTTRVKLVMFNFKFSINQNFITFITEAISSGSLLNLVQSKKDVISILCKQFIRQR